MKHVAPDEPPQLARRREPGRIRAIVLAVVVHAAFFALIVFGVTWQVKPTPPVQAELWSQLPPTKAEPKPEPPKPEPPPPEPPKPEPVKPEPVKPEPPKPEPVKPEPPRPDPEIALKAEREKKERERREKLEDEKREKEKRERAEKQKREQDEAAKKKREQDEAAKKKREQDEAATKKKREDDKRRAEEEVARKAAEQARDAAAASRKSEFDGWVEKIRGKIRGRANVPDSVTGKPVVTFHIRILPGGEVLDIQLTKGSGNPAYDAAIERAIRSASPLPVPPANSELFQQFRDLNLQIQHER